MPKTPILDAHNSKAQYDVIGNFQYIFYVKMATSEGRGGKDCISLVRKQPNQVRIFPATLLQISSSWCDSNLKRGGSREVLLSISGSG